MKGIKPLLFGIILALAGIFFLILAFDSTFGDMFGLILVVFGIIFGIAGLISGGAEDNAQSTPPVQPAKIEKSEAQSNKNNEAAPANSAANADKEDGENVK